MGNTPSIDESNAKAERDINPEKMEFHRRLERATQKHYEIYLQRPTVFLLHLTP